MEVLDQPVFPVERLALGGYFPGFFSLILLALSSEMCAYRGALVVNPAVLVPVEALVPLVTALGLAGEPIAQRQPQAILPVSAPTKSTAVRLALLAAPLVLCVGLLAVAHTLQAAQTTGLRVGGIAAAATFTTCCLAPLEQTAKVCKPAAAMTALIAEAAVVQALVQYLA